MSDEFSLQNQVAMQRAMKRKERMEAEQEAKKKALKGFLKEAFRNEEVRQMAARDLVNAKRNNPYRGPVSGNFEDASDTPTGWEPEFREMNDDE